MIRCGGRIYFPLHKNNGKTLYVAVTRVLFQITHLHFGEADDENVEITALFSVSEPFNLKRKETVPMFISRCRKEILSAYELKRKQSCMLKKKP